MSAISQPPKSRWRPLAAATAIQVAGATAGFATLLFLARVKGPAAQGVFSSVKAEIDFLVAALLLGAPQSLFYFVRQKQIGVRQAITVVKLLAAVSLVVVLSWGSLPHLSGGAGSLMSIYVLTLAAVVALAIVYGGLRGTVLAQKSVQQFAVLSALPNFLLCVLVGAGLLLSVQIGESRAQTAAVFLLVYAVSAMAAIRLTVVDVGDDAMTLGRQTIVRLARYGVATWLPALCQSASVLFVVRWLEARAVGGADVGIFTAAIAMVAIAIMPLNLVSPLIFREWTGLQRASRHREFIVLGLTAAGFAVLLAAAFYLWASPIVGLVLGPEYAEQAATFQLMILAILPQYLSKLWGVLYSAGGYPGIAVIVESARLLLIVGGVAAVGAGLADIVGVWVMAEYVTMLFGFFVMYGATRFMSRKGSPEAEADVAAPGNP